MNFINIIISLIAGLRTSGPDYHGYKKCFESIPDTVEYFLNIGLDYCGSGSTEWLYYLYLSIFKSLNLSFQYLIFSLSALHCFLVYKLSKKFKYPNKFLFGYFCTVGFYFQFWYIKQGIATLILLLGIYNLYVTKYQKKKGITQYIITASIHNSSIFVEIFLALIRIIKNKLIVILTIFFLLIYIYNNNLFINAMSIIEIISTSKYNYYLNSEFDKAHIGLLSILCITFIIFHSIISNEKNIGVYLMVIGVWTILIFGQIPLSGRISTFYMPLGIIIYFQFLIVKYKNNISVNFMYIIFNLIYFTKTYIYDDYNLNQLKSII